MAALLLPKLLILAATLLLGTIKITMASSGMAKPGCREKCGNLTIPFPFGIGDGCFYSLGFDVSCEDGRTYMHNSSSRLEIYNISLFTGQVRVSSLIASECYNTTGRIEGGWASASTADLFTISSKANKLTAIGCNTLAFLKGYNEQEVGAGCFSMCLDKQSVDSSGQCSGMGCCQTSIAPNLTSFNVTFDSRFNNSQMLDFNPCSYAFVAEQDWFKFEPTYLEGNKMTEKFNDGVPAVLDWVVGYESCNEAQKNKSSYACVSTNSRCISSPGATGYLCVCNNGFAGNAYLSMVSADIDECKFPDQYPCHGICSNAIGDYSCSCQRGTHSIDPKKETWWFVLLSPWKIFRARHNWRFNTGRLDAEEDWKDAGRVGGEDGKLETMKSSWNNHLLPLCYLLTFETWLRWMEWNLFLKSWLGWRQFL